ncbi:MAG: BrnT family toxin [Pseudolabrys sp.]|nr:BrnT family toxin [Pseudolabrys sp.]MCW5694983.1 BrnT family toxin [Pseudolabrys sp.]
MIDLGSIEGFEWDDGNLDKSLRKHGVSPAEAEQVFAGEPLLAQDARHSETEARFHALGETAEGRRLHVTFTVRDHGKALRIISARDMNRKERAIYEQEA